MRPPAEPHAIPLNPLLEKGLRPHGAGGKLAAVLVIHGMGQQVPFETLDLVYQGLRRVEAAARGDPEATLRPQPAERVDGDTKARFLKVHLGAKAQREVHLYEGYWAPFTEGKVTLRDVMAFLATGAANGLGHAFGRRRKWLFDGPKEMPVAGRTLLQLVAATLVLAGLVAVAAVSSLAFASAASGVGLPPNAVSDLTWLALAIALPAVAMGACIGLSLALKHGWRRRLATRPSAPPALASLFDLLGLALFVLTVLAASAIVVGLAVAAAMWPFRHVDYAQASLFPLLPAWVPYVAWALLVAAVGVARHALVQSLGDVAAFVNTHKLDRFNDVRNDIKKAIRDVAHAIYDAKDADGTPLYGTVCIVGHSLGSVVAYNTLNDLVSEDGHREPAQQRGVLQRTRLLLTFGSPLAKTSFIYGLQRRKTSDTREALAGLVQPLIQKYDYRTMDWVNIHAGADIISGRLRPEYDDPEKPGSAGRLVQDLPDPHARTPLLAHNEYWRNPLVWRELRKRLVPE